MSDYEMHDCSLNITIKNIQEIINIVNNYDCKTITDISKHSNKSLSSIRNTYNKIKENIYKNDNNIKINCNNALETEYIKRMQSALNIIMQNQSMLLYQIKYLQEILHLTLTETYAARTYAFEIIKSTN